jgi:hypothetical protein
MPVISPHTPNFPGKKEERRYMDRESLAIQAIEFLDDVFGDPARNIIRTHPFGARDVLERASVEWRDLVLKGMLGLTEDQIVKLSRAKRNRTSV